MMKQMVTGLAFSAGILLAWGAIPPAHAQYAPTQPQLVTNGPQASRGDFGDWSARRNNIESARYDQLRQTNWSFRQARMRKECGPIRDPQLHASCLASFDQYEPMYGSSRAPAAPPTAGGY